VNSSKLPGKRHTTIWKEWQRGNVCRQKQQRDKHRAQRIRQQHSLALVHAINEDTQKWANHENGNRCCKQHAAHRQWCPDLPANKNGTDPQDQCGIKYKVSKIGDSLSTPEQRKITINQETRFW